MTAGGAKEALQVAVLAGGVSAEREISLASGAAVAEALAEAGHRVQLIDPAETPLAQVSWSAVDVCFLALHGGAGEDGRVQRRLDLLRVPYTGSGPDASRLAMSKSAAKERFLDAGLPTPRYILFQTSDPLRAIDAKAQRLGYPLVVKPDSQGSSLGVSLVRSAGELAAAVAACQKLDAYAVAEQWVAGREFTVAVIDRQALPVVEIVAEQALFSFEAKYRSPGTTYGTEPELPAALVASLERVAVGACQALGTRGLARVDLMLDGDQRPWLLEVNTLPGMTCRSLAPRAARAAGMSFVELCDRLVRDAQPLEVVR